MIRRTTAALSILVVGCSPLAAPEGTLGVEVPLGESVLALRPSFEAGFLGRHIVLRGLLQLAFAP